MTLQTEFHSHVKSWLRRWWSET